MSASGPREAALAALSETALRNARLDQALERALETKLPKSSSARDRALARALAYGTCRHWHRLCHVRDQLLDRPLKAKQQPLGILLLMGLYQLFELRIPSHAAVNESVELARRVGFRWAASMVNAILRRALREREQLEQSFATDSALALSHPTWLLEAMQQAWPQDWLRIAQANNEQAPMTLRVNSRQGEREHYRSRLLSAGISAHMPEHLAQGLELESPVDVEKLPGFRDGAVSVQDGAAQLAAQLIGPKPTQRILDACAAPGGKTAHILESCPDLAELVAVDRSPARLRRVEDSLSRLGLADRARCLALDAQSLSLHFQPEHFDAVLLDAPCTATGVIRRHPDIKLRRKADEVRVAANLQLELLRAVWPLLARGGTLLYATCSVLPAENDQVIDAFLTECHDATPTSIAFPFGSPRGVGHQILPGDGGMDGFFYARLAKA